MTYNRFIYQFQTFKNFYLDSNVEWLPSVGNSRGKLIQLAFSDKTEVSQTKLKFKTVSFSEGGYYVWLLLSFKK